MPDQTGPAQRAGGRTRRRLIAMVLAFGVVAGVFFYVLPSIANYGDVWDVLSGLSRRDALLLGAATVVNLVTFAPPWMATLPGLGFRQAFAMSQASTALSIVAPAGAAVGMAGSYSMLRSWGFGGGNVGLAVAVTGIWNQFANLVFPIVGLALLTGVDEDHPALRTAAFVGLLVLVAAAGTFAAALSSERRAHRLGELSAWVVELVYRLARRSREVGWGGPSVARFRGRTLDLLRRRWHVITAATLLGHLTVFLVLLASVRAVGTGADDVSWIEVFAAWSLVRILGALPLTPAGLGFVELGLTGALVAFGAPNADAVAATLLYRFLTVAPTLALGLLAAVTWRTHRPGG